MLYALRGAKKPDNSCPADLQNKRKNTTIKDIITTKSTKNYNVLDNDNTFQLEMSDFRENKIRKFMYENEPEVLN